MKRFKAFTLAEKQKRHSELCKGNQNFVILNLFQNLKILSDPASVANAKCVSGSLYKSSKYVIGLMSGTSFDGVDCVLCKINPDLSFEVLKSDIFNYPLLIKKEIFKLIKGDGAIAELCTLNTVLGDFYAECALKLCKNASFDIKNVDLISSHGQTIFHNPSKEKFLNYTKNSTLQIGELSVIAKKTGVVTVGDFRPCDMALDGQGAPLVPFFDKVVFGDLNKNVAIQNLGGIANVTIIGKKLSTLPTPLNIPSITSPWITSLTSACVSAESTT